MEVSEKLFIFGARFAPAVRGTGGIQPQSPHNLFADAVLRERLVGDVAAGCLAGRTSPLYSKLYAKGLINNTFSIETDYSAKTAVIMAGGESSDPDAVLGEFTAQCDNFAKNGVPDALFERIKRAEYGASLKGLGSFSGICHGLAAGAFEGYSPLDAFGILPSITGEEVREYIARKLTGDKIALSVITPTRGDNGK